MNLNATQLSNFRAGINSALGKIQTQLGANVFAETLPVVGANLGELASADSTTASNAGLKKIAALKDALGGKLAALSAGTSDTAVLKAVNDALKEQGFTPTAKLINGGSLMIDFSAVTGSGTFNANVANDLGMPGLDIALNGTATTKGTVNYDMNFQAGLTSGDAFFLQQSEGAELGVALDVNAGAFSKVSAKMGNLPYLVSAASPDLLAANFAVELDGSGNVSSAKVQSGAATPKFQLFTNFGAGAAMPGVGSTLDVGWDLAGATLDADPNNVGFGAVPQVAFNNIGLDPGSFASGVAAQALSNIVSALGPVISIAQKVSAPIPGIGPILNKLGLGGTFIDIIAGPGSPTAEAVKKVAGLGDIVSAVNNIAKNGGTAVDFGSISFTTDGNGADIRSDAFSLGNVTPHVTTLGPGASASATLKKLGDSLAGNGVAFPILQDSGEIFKFVLGQPANLITYNPGAVVAELPDFSQSFPVFPGVNVGVAIGASVGFNLGFGFDTRGISDYAAGGFSDASQLLNGLFLTDFAGTPEAFFEMRIGATASIGIPAIAEGGVEGGIRGTINADFKDNFNVAGHPELANDGKLSYQEIASAFQSSANPLNLFDISGRIEAYLAAYLEFLFYTKRFDLGSFTIFDFEAEKAAAANTPVPVLAGADPFTANRIRIFIGDDARFRTAGADGEQGESIRIRPVFNDKGVLVPGKVVISSATTTALDGTPLGLLGGDITLSGKDLLANGGGGADVFRVSDDVKLPLFLIGGAGKDFMQGGAGNDTLHGGLDNDQIFGGKGNDKLAGIENDDELYGGEGKDTLEGGSGNDQLFGDDGNDVLYGAAQGITFDTGDDTLQGGAGNDSLFGSQGDDVLDGGIGTDTMDGGGGGLDNFFVDTQFDVIKNPGANSRIFSRASYYTLPDGVIGLVLEPDLSEDGTELIHKPIAGVGNELDNTIIGNEGDNFISGQGGADSVIAGLGDDDVNGGIGNDTLKGGDGNDTLSGGDGDDSLIGGEGDDFLNGGLGVDVLEGGNGSDSYVIDAGDTIIDSGGANDLVASEDTVDLTLSGAGGIEGVFLFGTKNSNAIGNGQNNRLVGNAGKNKLVGNAGQDTLEGGKGDTLEGGTGNDLYRITSNKVTVVENEGAANGADDAIQSTVGIKIPLNVESFLLYGSDKYEVITGNDQANGIVVGHQGKATVSAAGGNDIVIANFLGISSSLNTTIYGGSGNDSIGGSNYDDLIFGGDVFIAPNDTFPDDDSIESGLGNDTIFTGKGRDFVDAGAGNDYIHTLAKEVSTLRGGLGDDTYEIANGGIFNVLLIDEATGGGGKDTIVSYVDADLLMTRVGGGTVVIGSIEVIELAGTAITARGDGIANVIFGQSNNNVLDGRGGADTIFGGDGKDTLDGRDGGTAARDELYGGRGDDVFLVDDVLDAVIENINEGRDRVESSVNFTLGTHVEDLFLSGTAINGVGNRSDNLIRGNDQPNVLDALLGNDSVFGGGGGDTISGGEGKDELHGQAGNDSILGGGGDDMITGNDGADTLRGGGGNDRIYGQAEFNSGGDDYTDDGAADMLFGDDGNDTLVGFGGDDTLDGGDGNDGMSGGTGNDSYYVNSPGDVVFEIENAGIDSVRSSVTFTIPKNVETLLLTGVANINATGSKNAERLVGNAGNNVITALGGADTLEGGNGSDSLFGGDGDDALFGDIPGFTGSGDDYLDGGAGNDVMSGGFGNDTYIVDSLGDTVTDQPGQGFDTIRTSVGYTAPLGVEELIYTGTVGVTLNGAGGPNRIFGGPKNDVLNPSATSGGSGIETLFGGKGDDTYFVDELADIVSENPGEGKDRVFSFGTSYTLGDNVENLNVMLVAGAGTNDGTGNDLATEIIGSGGLNVLRGMGGNDTLTGGGGADTLDGGNGNDVFIIQDRDTVIHEGILGGYDKAIVQVNNFVLNPGAFVEEVQVAAVATVLSASGNNLANIITANNFGNGLNGGGGSDTLNGGTGDDYLTGTDAQGILEIDVLVGGAGADHFQLTSGADTFYDDGIAATTGTGDFAWIKDFKASEGDRITMTGGMSGRVLFGATQLMVAGKSVTGTGLYFDVDGDGILDLTDTAANDELLALFEGPNAAPTIADIDFILV